MACICNGIRRKENVVRHNKINFSIQHKFFFLLFFTKVCNARCTRVILCESKSSSTCLGLTYTDSKNYNEMVMCDFY